MKHTDKFTEIGCSDIENCSNALAVFGQYFYLMGKCHRIMEV